MKFKKLASEIAKKEGNKSQVRIGDIREILGILSDIMYESHQKDTDLNLSYLFYINGKKRAKKNEKKK